MSYEANYDTATTYLKAGLKDRANEAFLRAYHDIPESQKNSGNVIYFKVLTLLVKNNLEEKNPKQALAYIQEGLKKKEDHMDLLFLEALLFWEGHCYVEMFDTLIGYLVSATSPDTERFQYEFAGKGAFKEVFESLLPHAYKKASVNQKTITLLQQLAEKTGHPILQHAQKIIHDIDKEKGLRVNGTTKEKG